MHLIELQIPDTGDSADQIARLEQPERSAGCHVSDVIRYLEHTVTKKGTRPPREEMTKAERSRMGKYASLGWAWERIVRHALNEVWSPDAAGHDRYLSPGELEHDGLLGTPDWFDTEDLVLEEFKCTWRSSRRPIESDYWGWFVQIKAYCYMLSITEARLRVFYVNGDYRDSGPQIKMWHIEFTYEELIANWLMLKRAQKEMERGL